MRRLAFIVGIGLICTVWLQGQSGAVNKPAPSKAEAKPGAKPAVAANSTAKPAPKQQDPKAAVAKAEAKQQVSKPAATPVPKPEAKPVSKPEVKSASKPELKSASKPEIKPANNPPEKKTAISTQAISAGKPVAPAAEGKPAVKNRALHDVPHGQSAPISGRPPAVAWKRGMPVPAPLVPSSDASVDPPFDPSGPAVTGGIAVVPTALNPRFKSASQLAAPPPVIVSNREQVLKELEGIHPGSTHAEVLAKLGRPAYTIAMPDGAHYIERCRFRAGFENIVSIEFRDGIVATVDRIAR